LPLSSPSSPRPFYYPKQGSALHCGKVSLETLAKRHGTPLYVYSGDQIVERLGMFQQALASREHLICYAVKANSALAILKLLADHGAGFDIVSGENWSECWPPRRRLWAGSYSRVREKRRPRSTGR